CTVPNLSNIAPDARAFEDVAPVAPSWSLYAPAVELELDFDVYKLTGALSLARGSGFRPFSYQQHLHELRTRLADYNKAVAGNPNQQAACQALKATLDYEIDKKHQIKRQCNGTTC